MSCRHDGISDGSELIDGEESRSVETIVGLESNSEEGSVRFHGTGDILELSAVARHLAIHCHVIGYFDVITGRCGYTWNHAFDVEVRERDLDALADLGVEEVVTLGIARIKSREVGTPERSIGGHRAVELESARHCRYLVTRRYSEI